MTAKTGQEKGWFITGVGSGLGLVLARAALAAGDRVVGTVRREDQCETFAALAPGRALACLADVTDVAAVNAAVTTGLEFLGQLDVVVNNAGYGLFGATEEVSDQEVRAQFETNVFGVWHVLRAVLPYLRARRSGHIVQLSSAAGILATGGVSAYNASKFALEGLSEALAFEVAPLGIAVTLVEPGVFRTGFHGPSVQIAERSLPDYPMGAAGQRPRLQGMDGRQPGDPEKAAAAILRLVNHPSPPTRLVLGDDSWQRVSAKLAWVQAEMNAWEAVSRGTAYGGELGPGLPAFQPPQLRRG